MKTKRDLILVAALHTLRYLGWLALLLVSIEMMVYTVIWVTTQSPDSMLVLKQMDTVNQAIISVASVWVLIIQSIGCQLDYPRTIGFYSCPMIARDTVLIIGVWFCWVAVHYLILR